MHSSTVTRTNPEKRLARLRAIPPWGEISVAMPRVMAHDQGRHRQVAERAGNEMAEREGFEPGSGPSKISKLLISHDLMFPQNPWTPRIWHQIWHRRSREHPKGQLMLPAHRPLHLAIRAAATHEFRCLKNTGKVWRRERDSYLEGEPENQQLAD